MFTILELLSQFYLFIFFSCEKQKLESKVEELNLGVFWKKGKTKAKYMKVRITKDYKLTKDLLTACNDC